MAAPASAGNGVGEAKPPAADGPGWASTRKSRRYRKRRRMPCHATTAQSSCLGTCTSRRHRRWLLTRPGYSGSRSRLWSSRS